MNSTAATLIVSALVANGCNALTIVILLVSVPFSILVSMTILSWTLGKTFTARFSSFFIPRAMASIDVLFGDTRTELLQYVHGSVLDVGCADGQYLKYYDKPEVSKIVFLEPNTFHHPRLQKHINTMQTQHPSTLGKTEIVVEGRFIEELEISVAAAYRPQMDVKSISTPSRQTRSAVKRQQQCTDEILHKPLRVGECVEYIKQGVVPATVIEVHRDDYPHVYYTIRIGGEDGDCDGSTRPREKQTDATYLRRLAPTNGSENNQHHGSGQGFEHGSGQGSESVKRPGRGQADGQGGVDSEGEGGGFDWVILGNVLCEVPDQEGVLGHVSRLLRPGGSVYFSEHIAHPPGTFLRWVQERLNPWWCCVSDGCNMNRPTLDRMLDQFASRDGWVVQYWQVDVGMLVPFVLGVATKGRGKS